MSTYRKISLLIVATAFGIGVAMLLDKAHHPRDKARPARPAPTAGGIPKRMAVFSVAAVEIIFALDAGDQIVGTTRFATYPPEAASIVKLGGVMDINFERLAAVEPDLIMAQSHSRRLAEFAKERGIPFWHLTIETIDDVLTMIDAIGDRLGRAEAASTLRNDLEAHLARIRRKHAGKAPVPCFLSVDRPPGQMSQLLSPGKPSFLTELVGIAGGRNVFGDIEDGYPTVSKEALMSRQPEVILEIKPGRTDPETRQHLIADWDLLASVPAVSNRRISIITHEAALLPSLRMAAVAEAMARALHEDPIDREANSDD